MIRLVKYWFNSYKFFIYFIFEFIEFVILYIFLLFYFWDVFFFFFMGFNCVLLFLFCWDWCLELLIIDLGNELINFDYFVIVIRMEVWRKIDLGMNYIVFFVVIIQELIGIVWISLNNELKLIRVVVMRMMVLVKVVCRVVREEQLLFDLRRLFVFLFKEYDVFIYFDFKVLKNVMRMYENVDFVEEVGEGRGSKFKNLDVVIGEDLFFLVVYLVEVLLEQFGKVFGGLLVFFWGGEGDNVVGVIWNLGMERRVLKGGMLVSYRLGRQQQEGDGEDKVEVEMNKEVMVGEMVRLGGDLVERIEMRQVV